MLAAVRCSVLLARSLRNKSSKDIAFPHPQSQKDHYRKKDKPEAVANDFDCRIRIAGRDLPRPGAATGRSGDRSGHGGLRRPQHARYLYQSSPFALRNPHGAQLRIYEVDHPATQAWKRQRLAEAQIALPPWLILVPVDFEQDDVGEKLVAAGFQQNSPAFFTWLGVVPYLTQDTIGRTLDYMSSIQNSEVVFDYLEPPVASSEELKQFEKERSEQLKKMNERSVSRFEPAGIAAILRPHGFCAIEDINFQEIASRFGRGVQGLAPGHLGVHVVHAKH